MRPQARCPIGFHEPFLFGTRREAAAERGRQEEGLGARGSERGRERGRVFWKRAPRDGSHHRCCVRQPVSVEPASALPSCCGLSLFKHQVLDVLLTPLLGFS